MKKFFILLFLSLSGIIFGQVNTIIPEKKDSISFEADCFIGFDGFGNCVYTKNDVLFKKSNAEVLQYQNPSLGRISKVDILNPLKIIVFYEDFNTVEVLDNQLNEIQKIDFSTIKTSDKNLILVTACGIAGQNKIWIYNSLNQRVGLYDLTNNQYSDLGNPISDGFTFYQTNFNYFYWVNNQNQWHSCNFYGKKTDYGYVEVTSDIQFLEKNKILFKKNNTLYIRDRNINKLYEIEIVEKSFKDFFYKDQILSIFTDKGITNYKITIP